jgi:hypothetical protein
MEASRVADVNSQLMKTNKQKYMERDLLQRECDATIAKINKNDVKIRKLVDPRSEALITGWGRPGSNPRGGAGASGTEWPRPGAAARGAGAGGRRDRKGGHAADIS